MEQKRPAYNPLYWLGALGPGGLAVSFFVYANFMVPHKGVPMLTFDHAYPMLMKGGPMAYLIGAVYVLFLIATVYHFKLLFWNTKEFLAYKKTEAYKAMYSVPRCISTSRRYNTSTKSKTTSRFNHQTREAGLQSRTKPCLPYVCYNLPCKPIPTNIPSAPKMVR